MCGDALGIKISRVQKNGQLKISAAVLMGNESFCKIGVFPVLVLAKLKIDLIELSAFGSEETSLSAFWGRTQINSKIIITVRKL